MFVVFFSIFHTLFQRSLHLVFGGHLSTFDSGKHVNVLLLDLHWLGYSSIVFDHFFSVAARFAFSGRQRGNY